MQSQCSQDSSFSGPLSLSLSKFSYATVPEDSNAPIPWVHLSSRGNLFAVFEKCRAWNHQGQLHDQSKFRVTNGAEVMEDLNLIALAAEARKATVQNQVSNVLNRPSAATIIVKKPCVAVRYPSGQGQIRRFQIRFLHDTDYYAAMGRFLEANAPVTEAGTFPIPQPQPRPISSPSSVLYPSDSASHHDAKPPSTPPVVQSNRSGTSTLSIPNGAEALLRPATSTSSITQTSTLIHRMPQTILTGNCNQKDVHTFPQDALVPSPVLPHSGTTTSQYWKAGHVPMKTSNKPSDVEYLVNHTLTPSIVWSAPVPTSSHAPINLYEPRPSTAPVIESQGLAEMLPPKRDLPFGKPVSRDGSKASTTTKGMAEAPLSALKPKEDNDHRSSSAMPFHFQELDTQSAPPKAKSKRAPAKKGPARVTKKPAPPRSRKKAASVRASSPVPSLEELLRRSQGSAKNGLLMPKIIDTQALLAQVEERQATAANQGLANKSALGPNRSRQATVVDHEDERPTPFAPLKRMEQTLDVSSFEKPTPQAGTISPVSEVLDSREGRYRQSQAVPISGQGTPPDIATTAPVSPTVGQASSERPQNFVPINCEPSPQPLTSQFGGPLASLLQDPNFAGSPNIAQWAKGPEEERRASLETFICRSIQDENFFNLCKDLDGTWQRVFLGKIG